MNINKIISKISFDDFLDYLNRTSEAIVANKLPIFGYLHLNRNATVNQIKDKLFIYFVDKIYHKEISFNELFYTDMLMYKLLHNNLIDEDLLKKFKDYFIHITPELNAYFLNCATTEDKEFLFSIRSIFLTDIYKYNEKRVSSDKNFVLEYIKYVPIRSEHFNIILTIYPELIESNIKKIQDINFVRTFYYNLFEFNSDALTTLFLNKYFNIFLSGVLTKDIVKQLTCKKIFFKLTPIIQKKLKDFANS